MEGTFDPAEGLEGKIQRTILLWMRTFHPKEGLIHMEEGWMLAEEGLFHSEEPSFLLWMTMMLPKEGTFLPKEGTVLLFQPPLLPKDRSMLPDGGLFHLGTGTLLYGTKRYFSMRDWYFQEKGRCFPFTGGPPSPPSGDSRLREALSLIVLRRL